MSKLMLIKRDKIDDRGRRRAGGYVINDDHIITNIKARKNDTEFIELSVIIERYNRSKERYAAAVTDITEVLVRFNCCCGYCVNKPPHMGTCEGCGYVSGYKGFVYKEKAVDQNAQL